LLGDLMAYISLSFPSHGLVIRELPVNCRGLVIGRNDLEPDIQHLLQHGPEHDSAGSVRLVDRDNLVAVYFEPRGQGERVFRVERPELRIAV
jgi:hypothetical protein